VWIVSEEGVKVPSGPGIGLEFFALKVELEP
jgi:hypothetical protein